MDWDLKKSNISIRMSRILFNFCADISHSLWLHWPLIVCSFILYVLNIWVTAVNPPDFFSGIFGELGKSRYLAEIEVVP